MKYMVNFHPSGMRPLEEEKEQPTPDAQEAIRLARGLTSHQEENDLNILKIAFFLLIVICFTLGFFAYYTWKETGTQALLAVIATCLVTMVGSLLGIIGSFKSIAELKFRHLIIARERPAYGHDILISAFYFLIVVFTCFLVFGSRALFFYDHPMSYLEALYNSPSGAWAEKYGEKSLEEVEEWAILMTSLVGYLCYLTAVIITVITYLMFVLSTNYEAIHSILEVINLGVMVLAMGVIYTASYCLNYRREMGLKEIVPYTISVSSLLLGLFMVCICALGYVMARKEKLKLMKYYIAGNLLLILSCSLVFCFSLRKAEEFKENLIENCFDFMALVGEDFVATLGCEPKYILSSSSEDFLNCDKTQLRYIWENSNWDSRYGCLNPMCCETLVTEAKTKFDYLSICAISTVFLSGIALWGCYFFHKKLNRLGVTPPQLHRADHKILLFMILLPVGLALCLQFLLPGAPSIPPYLEPKVKVDKATFVDQRLMSSGFCYSGAELGFEGALCDSCELHADVSGFNGVVESSSESVSAAGNGYSFVTKDYKKLNEVVKNSKLCPSCPYKETKLKVEVFDENQNKLTEQEFSYNPERVQDEYWGKVYPKDSLEFVDLLVPYCETTTLPVSSKTYSHRFSMGPYRVPYKAYLSYKETSRVLQVGGIPMYPHKIPFTEVVQKGSNYSLAISSLDLHSLVPLESYQIEIREGYNNYTGPLLMQETQNTNINLPAGTYSIKGTAQGYKEDRTSYSLQKDSELKLLFTPDDFQENEIRVVLGWKNSEIDLDLRVNFILNSKFTCEVNFSNMECGGARLRTSSRPEGPYAEELIVNSIGAYQYLFYLKDFRRLNDTKSTSITDSGGSLKVYVKNYAEPLVEFYMEKELDWKDSKKEEYRIWLGFCLDGRKGVASIFPIETYMNVNEQVEMPEVCQEVYGSPAVFEPEEEYSIEADLSLQSIPPEIVLSS